MAKRKKRQPKPKPTPEQACEAFLAEVPGEIYAALPDDVVEVMEDSASDVLLLFPGLSDNPRVLRVLVGRRLRAHYRQVGWEFDEEKCRAFMDLLIEYLPIFIALLATKHPAIAAALAA